MGEDQKKRKPQYRDITIRTSAGSTIKGKVNISEKERLSDLFTSSEPQFLIVVDAYVREGHSKILFVNKQHIVWAEPGD
ncbi:MAG: hypothetical protein JRH18_00535 [Deltaproteobacteria bacterium]|nr:hypothetical protein [Deltaproteobacteria bacterium]MBW1962567.1 hypothetical protein [Deltaproteobacteria bacterium]MBW2150133.1 hypothetical protein [Deltaproteobacteria bacterium]